MIAWASEDFVYAETAWKGAFPYSKVGANTGSYSLAGGIEYENVVEECD